LAPDRVKALDVQRRFPSPASAPPAADRNPVDAGMHGRVRQDPYAWLRDANWRDVMRDPSRLDPAIRTYLQAENAWTHDHLDGPTAALQEALFQEMRGRIKEDDSSAPALDGPFAYYRRFREGGEYPLFARRPADRAFDGDPACEHLLLDGDALGAGLDYFDIRKFAHSPDHRFIAYAVDAKGSEFYTLHIRDAGAGEDAFPPITDTYGEFVWDEDSASIFWVARDEQARPVAVYRRTLATGVDDLIYRESDPGFFVGVHKSESRRFIFVTANDHTTSEWRFFETSSADPAPRLIAPRTRNIEYAAVHWGDRFWIRTNRNGAVDFSLVSAPVDNPGPDSWRVEIPHRPGVLILGVEAYAGHLVRMERENGLPRIIVRAASDASEHALAFGEAAYSLAISGSHEWATPWLRFEYASPSTPAQVFDYHMTERTRILRKQQEVPSGHDPSDYVVERIDAPADDGALIPITLLRRRTTPVDGSAPVLLYGYGAYGITLPADFRTARLSLVDRGFIFATADVRGSMAKGYQWYLDGKLERKANSFSDFVAAGRFLANAGYTRRGRMVAMGGSAGGMLVGAAVNLDPELFAGVIAAVPFVDVLNTMMDDQLPLTPPEWPEWGDPLRDPEAYDRLASWSPYDQTHRRPYPPMLVTGGLTDPRVTYWEPAKWVARLRHEAPDGGPYFLRINMDAGHGGASGRFTSLRETALEYAFALLATGEAALDGL
jgi:oligopeptidase B